MKQHLLRVTRPVVEFGGLIAAARQLEERVGWLEWPKASQPAVAPGPLPESLAVAAGLGVLRAVAIDGGLSVAVKPMRGEPVLHDVLREHFRGCRLVLVTGEIDAPRLEPSDDEWIVHPRGRPAARWTTDRLIAALRKPRPWV